MSLFAPDIVIQKIKAGFQFNQAELSRLKLEAVNLDQAKFIQCYMRGAILTDVSCHQTNFKQTNLAFSRLNGVDLSQANLERTELNSATLNNSILDSIYLLLICVKYRQLKYSLIVQI